MQTMSTADEAPEGAAEDAPPAAGTDHPAPDRARERPVVAAGHPARWLLAALLGSAGVIHLVMVPQHAQESRTMGLAFAAAGWVQLAVALAVVTRSSRRWLQLAVASSVLFAAVWALSRTVGLPDWTGDGGVGTVAAVDVLCTALEGLAAVVALALLLVPDKVPAPRRPAVVLSGIAAVATLLLTTGVLTAPSTASHQHGEAAAPGHGDGAPHGHDDAAMPAHGHGPAAAGGGHAHAESDLKLDQLPAVTKAEVEKVSAEWARKYPTAADAKAAGWMKATPNLYGIGAHYLKNGSTGFATNTPFDMMDPNILLYDGEGEDAPFAGLSYVHDGDVEGFTGEFDFWHGHNTICMIDRKVSLTEENSKFWYSDAECPGAGGRVMNIADRGKMIHLWIGPGYTDAPIFAHDHPLIYDGWYPKQPK